MTIEREIRGEDAPGMSGTQTPDRGSDGETPTPTSPAAEDTLEQGNGNNCTDNDNDDDVTVIVLEAGDDEDEMVGNGWIDQDSPEIQERRRNVLLRELQRVQRASFIHFMILCLIPTSLLFIVIATVLGEDDECESVATTCEKEPRTFISKFGNAGFCDKIEEEVLFWDPIITNKFVLLFSFLISTLQTHLLHDVFAMLLRSIERIHSEGFVSGLSAVVIHLVD